jgi:hypothetical protein
MVEENKENKENEDVFNQLDETDETQKMEEVSEDEFRTLSSQIKYDKVLKPEDEGKVFAIASAQERKPYVKNSMGNQIQPKQMSSKDSTKVGYPSSLTILLKDTNYIVNVSGLTYYLSKENGKNIYTPWFKTDVKEDELEDQYTSQLSNLFFKYCKFKKLDIRKVTANDFKNALVGMKVKVITKKGKFNGQPYEKIQIVDFVE